VNVKNISKTNFFIDLLILPKKTLLKDRRFINVKE